jgi:hypothetical protein
LRQRDSGDKKENQREDTAERYRMSKPGVAGQKNGSAEM